MVYLKYFTIILLHFTLNIYTHNSRTAVKYILKRQLMNADILLMNQQDTKYLTENNYTWVPSL